MKTVRIKRRFHSDQGTLGDLVVDDLKLITLELPWRNNERMISCIPAGIYKCSTVYWNRVGRKVYQVNGVPKRTSILIHGANYAGDSKLAYRTELQGCIALGLGFITTGQLMLTNSRPAVAKFERFMNGEEFQLEITGA